MTAYHDDPDRRLTLLVGRADAVLPTLAEGSVNCVMTSPPYFGLRDYDHPDQTGLEATPTEYVEALRAVFAEVRRVLANDGTLWLNLGDSYAGTAETGRNDAQKIGRDNLPQYGSLVQAERKARRLRVDYGLPAKNLLGIPWRVAFALQADGWILRNAVVWHKPNAMPESVKDRLSRRHETVFLLTKSQRYWFDLDQVRVPTTHAARGHAFGGEHKRSGATGRGGVVTRYQKANPLGRNPGDVWSISTSPFPEAHFATMAPKLAEQMVLSGCRPGGVVLDPYSGAGTSGQAALRHGRGYVGIDIKPEYHDLALRTRLAQKEQG